jgi:hypothetical protein
VGNYGQIALHARVIGRPIRLVNSVLEDHQGSYDLVAVLSVIEHVKDDIGFFLKALGLVNPGGCLVLTTDFHPSGGKQVEGHLRTYNAQSMDVFWGLAGRNLFAAWGGLPNYDYFGHHVYHYSFCSLVLRRMP